MAGPSSLLDALPDPGARRRLRAARLVLRIEAVWPLLVWMASLAALFVALAAFDLPARLPGWLHALLLAAFAAVFAGLVRAAWRARRVEWAAAARRLEADGGLPHRPFQTLWDQPAGGDGGLWSEHRRRAAQAVAAARLSFPRSDMAVRDPFGLRAAALLLLAVALAGGGDPLAPRLARALVPAVGLPGWGPDSLQVWITPPTYTGLPPLLLPAGEVAQPVPVPVGSTVLGVLSGGWGGASLRLDGGDVAFVRQDDGGQRVETQIQGGEILAVRQLGRQVAAWPIRVVADLSPDIDFASPPEAAERGRLHMAVVANDDHGLARLWVEIRRIGAALDEAPLVVDLPLPPGRPRQVGASNWHDLTAHPWAGLPVLVQPVAEDALGQRGAGEVLTLTLPERHFLNPNARMVIEQRRLLTENRNNAPGAMGVLDRLAVEPARFNDDLIAFLALRVARHALATPGFDLAEIQDLLWNAALRIEDGDLASAEQRLEDARRALEQGLDANLDEAALRALVDQFQAALQRYLGALSERLGAPMADMPAGGAISDTELHAMLDSLRDMAAIGARDGMRAMLRDLAAILDGLQAGMPQMPSGPAIEAMRGLRDLIDRQQRLLDQTHRRDQGHDPGGGGAGAARQQDELRHTLDGLRRQLGEGLGQEPAALAEADQAMAESAQALRQQDWGGAAQAQGQVLDLLLRGARQALEDMAAGAMLSPGGGMPRDPLGRANPGGRGGDDDGTTRVPDQAEMRKARAILDELRRRAGEFQRPRAEREYLQRLLRQF